ncbi:chitin-binding type-2 domain-containing protein [Caerostris darwini]|uniref:Chitin-binding type-2 domain-containing protein n=1 Tax=Caerostris darwini TaxID=1538125 RepID=A0AAV4U0Z3_9ARAC|nr:chitin-binding type-2 domain-containing protein [Caerostris darwini]
MLLLTLLSALLYSSSVAYGFTCPEGSGTFYHADLSSGCQVYHMCLDSEMATLRCLDGQVFDESKSRCVDPEEFQCIKGEVVRQKRSVDTVHSISIVELKESVKKLIDTALVEIKMILQEVAPSIYHVFETEYAPMFASIKKDLDPILNASIQRGQKMCDYVKKLKAKVVSKLNRSWEISNSTHINLLSFDDIIYDIQKDLKPLMRVVKYLQSRQNMEGLKSVDVLELSRPKRAFETVHSISIVELTENLKELVELLKSESKEIVKNVAPSIAEVFEENYITAVEETTKYLIPFFNSNVLPKINKMRGYVKTMAERVLKKLHTSWKMSNSTHINIVSFDDIVSDVSVELKPIIKFGKFLQARSRGKRSIDSSFDEIVKGIIKIGGGIIFSEDPLLSDFALPIFYEMIDDPETFNDMKHLLIIARNIYGPSATEMLQSRSFAHRGYNYRISQSRIDAARYQFFQASKGTIFKIIEKHLPTIFRRSAANVPLILESIGKLHQYSGNEVWEVKKELFHFFTKHSEFFLSNNPGYVNVNTFTAMKRDLHPIKVKLIKIAFDYLSHSPSGIIRFLFNRNSMLYRLF